MTIYAVATGHDVALESLNAMSPQPQAGIIRYTRRSSAASGAVHDEGAFVPLTWQILDYGVTAYQALLTQFGLNAAKTADVTVLVRSETLADVRMNGKAIRPMFDEGLSWSRFKPTEVVILVINLEAAA
jgi:hypothetical protein